MVEKVIQIREHRTIQQNLCIHHWIIEPPMGETSNGICKNCGGEKTFRNSLLVSDSKTRHTLKVIPEKRLRSFGIAYHKKDSEDGGDFDG